MVAKTRIGFNARYLRDYNLRGFNRYTLGLVTELQSQPEFEVVLFTDHRSPINPAFAEQISAEVVNITSPMALLWEQVMLPVAFRRHRIRLFHAPADAGLPAWKVCPYVLTYHHAPDESLEYFVAKRELPGTIGDYLPPENGVRGRYLRHRHRLLRRVYLQSADRVIAVSNYGKWELVELLRVPEEKVEVIYEGADASFTPDVPEEAVQEAKAKYGLPGRYFLFVGSFDQRKNVQGLLHAFAEARNAGVEEALVLVGTGGDLPGVKAAARCVGLQEGRDVLFLERIHEDLPALYCAAAVFITLSWSESFCLPIVEAMSCGTPVIASNQGAIPEILGGGGILVDPRNASEVVQAVKAVTTRAELQAQLRAKALGRAKDFSWKKAAQETLKVYEDLLRRSPGVTAGR